MGMWGGGDNRFTKLNIRLSMVATCYCKSSEFNTRQCGCRIAVVWWKSAVNKKKERRRKKKKKEKEKAKPPGKPPLELNCFRCLHCKYCTKHTSGYILNCMKGIF